MQFVPHGPEIPDALLQAHEEGRVVFFCGAGISYPAGLPGFKKLVEEIYRIVGARQNKAEQQAYKYNQFDAALDLLEARLPGQRIALRSAVAEALKPNLRRKGATQTHAALLRLARNHEGSLRLVTTNFDRVFERVAKLIKQPINSYSAPMLPIPKNSRWDGVVYLHGLLPNQIDEASLNQLVLTSGDFGLAYLTERWAARFVSELFRNYVVCFVGYSINDPVLRYMMDALAADRMLGEATPQAYAFGDFRPGQEKEKTAEWKAKGVKPILYEVPDGTNDHSLLHKTLKVWSETHRDGVLGKERIVIDLALARPSGSSKQDNFVGRMLWALSDESGLPAKQFANFDPVPPLAWLHAFCARTHKHEHLRRFGVSPHRQVDDSLAFSLIHRPAPYTRAPWMSLTAGGLTQSQWDDIMFHVARWLLRHLNDPELILWMTQNGGQLHERWVWLVENRLSEIARLEKAGNLDELDEIKTNAPNAIPGPLMRTLWRFILTGRIKTGANDVEFYRWQEKFNLDGLTPTLRLELRELLSPRIRLKKPMTWGAFEESSVESSHLSQIVGWEIELTADNVLSEMGDMKSEEWQDALPTMLEDFQLLLRDALDLLRELGEANDYSDQSFWDLPSISEHWQNRGFHDWVVLIELLRKAWQQINEKDTEAGTQIAQRWFGLPYPTFKRLALFAAAESENIHGNHWVHWLTADNAFWLWSIDTQRETMRLLRKRGASLSIDEEEKLESAILSGPPRSLYSDDLDPDEWTQRWRHSVWHCLAKLREGGKQLGTNAGLKLEELAAANPEWELQSYHRDEFPHWMSGAGDPDFTEHREIDIVPRNHKDLVVWLKQTPRNAGPFNDDNWRETCQNHFFLSFFALQSLANENCWPTQRWNEAIQAWGDEKIASRAWEFAGPLLESAPDQLVKDTAHSIGRWLKSASKDNVRHETVLIDMCKRVMSLDLNDGVDTEQPVLRAINHPIGHITEALLNLWFKRTPSDNDTLPHELEPLFSRLTNTAVDNYRHGRVILASRLIALFRVDPHWTETCLLPLLDWESEPVEAKAAWQGFLLSPRLYPELLIAFKSHFLETAQHYSELGEHRSQYAAFLTFAALNPVESYSLQDFETAFSALPQEGLREAARVLPQALESAGRQREDFWNNRIQPFWQQVWPKSLDLASSGIAESLARLCIAANDEFPTVLATVKDWLKPLQHPSVAVHLLQKSDLAERFPEEALELLNKIISEQTWPPKDLLDCVNVIERSMPALSADPRSQRLKTLVRRHRG
ncbi:SIR2 family protein [Marinobacteraceae bacterium S3BR75-40.1]